MPNENRKSKAMLEELDIICIANTFETAQLKLMDLKSEIHTARKLDKVKNFTVWLKGEEAWMKNQKKLFNIMLEKINKIKRVTPENEELATQALNCQAISQCLKQIALEIQRLSNIDHKMLVEFRNEEFMELEPPHHEGLTTDLSPSPSKP